MYYLGIDGGGSQTRALVCDASGRIFGRGLSGPSNLTAKSELTVRENLLDAMQQAASKIESTRIRAAYLGVAGASDPIKKKKLLKIAQEFFSSQALNITVDHDMRIALEGGLKGAPGLVLIAGTGSASFGRGTSGQTAGCGGWGDLVDDAGSGSWIGLKALQALFRQADGRLPKSPFMERIMHFLEIEEILEFKTHIHDQGLVRHERARLAPIVFDLAKSGDKLATAIMVEAIEELCKLAKIVSQKLQLPEPTVCLCGGLMQNPYFRNALSIALYSNGLENVISDPQLQAVSGAVMLALKSDNVTLNEQSIIELSKA
ncbi:MAG: BadF/BadG/BcrA/BcrD ATPase family protein [Verrucomicrobiota bacterium]|nr:BadF/BadG/BcrA/BcrD ATPase family protein [Verrucomicrobiota bacterium]